MKKVIFIPVFLLSLLMPAMGYSQASSFMLKKVSKKEKKFLVPPSFGQIPNAFCQPDEQPNVSPEDYYHTPSIKPGPWAANGGDTINNTDVFLGYRLNNNWFMEEPIGGISEEDTCTWISVVGLCMLVLVSPVDLEY